MASKSSTKNGKNLVIVESPAKSRTINKYLGSDYVVMASMGHVRDLPGKSMSIDIENGFKPTYEVLPSSRKTINQLKKAASTARMVYLATDMDREGEAIAWHVTEALGLKPEQYSRVVFNEITKKAIQQAFANAHDLNFDRVNAQQARRILDRIVGYEISPLLWKKVARGLSAGRVQSVAAKLIVVREREIQAFKPDEYWKITGLFSTSFAENLGKDYETFVAKFTEKEKGPTVAQRSEWLAEHESLEATLASVGGNTFKCDNGADCRRIHDSLAGQTFKVSEVQTKRTRSKPSAPFITSTLQQQGVNRLGFSTKRTMRIAQQLYEGMEILGQGSVGLITYMRTDSTHLAKEAVESAREFIEQEYGQEYLSDKFNTYGKNNRQAQEAHEAIRPTDVRLRPEDLSGDLDKDQMKLYEMIWKRFVACQMSPTQWDVTSISITAAADGGEAVFKASGRKLVFDGFMKVSGLTISTGEQLLPELKQGQEVNPFQVDRSQHFTAPPGRYTEASLVKSLESEGIGRPSTYATIISTIQDRGYVEQIDKKFHATDLGIVVTEKLDEFFPRVMDVAFTRHVEEQLDKISEQQLDWVEVLKEFYGPFKANLDRAHEEMVHAKAETQPSEYSCPKCKEPLVYRFGKNGRFLSCSAYPTCKFSSPCDREGKIQEVETSEYNCPVCGKVMLFRRSRFGTFLGCSGYPDCKTTQRIDKEGHVLPPKPPPKKSGIRCYKCKGELVIRESKRGPFLGCGSFPKCRTIVSIKHLDHLKELQEKGQWPPASRDEVDIILGRKKAATTKTKPKTKSKPKKKTVAKKA